MQLKNQKLVAIKSIGCRLNISEAGTFAKAFEEDGHLIVPFGQKADVILINTCTVTERAEATCRNLIRKARKSSPDAKIIVAGCYAQTSSDDEVITSERVDLVLGSFEKSRVFDYLVEIEREQKRLVRVSRSDEFFSSATSSAEGHTRAFLKIQDGCNYVCSYCIIPRARGCSRILPISDVLNEAGKLVDGGFKEIILTGVNIGEYKTDDGKNLYHLVEKLVELNGLERIRISSVEPNTITDELLSMMKESKKCMNHFHLPLQSGDDEILGLMRRKYTAQDYVKIVEKVKKYFPHAGIGADVIVGFPGEERIHYENTKSLIEKLPITHLHVFPFSRRKGTTAWNMEDTVHSLEKKERVQDLISLGEKKLNKFALGILESSGRVLFEKRDHDGYFGGYTSNYLRVKVKTDRNLKNSIEDVYFTNVENGVLYGEIT